MFKQDFAGLPYRTSRLPADSPYRLRGPGSLRVAGQRAANALADGQRVYLRAKGVGTRMAKRAESAIRRTPATAFGPPSKRAGSGPVPDYGLFGTYGFTEVTGLWLEWATQAGADLLSPFISTEGYVFTPTEFVDLRERLAVAARRYERLPYVSAALEDLNTGFFRHQEMNESQETIERGLETYLTAGAALHRDYLTAINTHDRTAGFTRRAQLSDRAARLAAFRARLAAVGPGASRKARRQLRPLLDEWGAYLAGAPDSPARAATDAAELTTQLAAEEQHLRQVREGLPRELKAAGLSLSPLTIDPAHGSAEHLSELADRLTELIRSVNEAGVYQLPVGGGEAATTTRQLRQLEDLLAKLRNTRRHLPEFPVFYERRHFWYAQPGNLRRVLAPLIDQPTDHWEAAFGSWYFERCLERAGDPNQYFTDPETLREALSVATPPDPPAGDQLTIIGPQDTWPAGATAGVLIDWTDDPPPANWTGLHFQLRPLHDASAAHAALAGQRDPRLTLVQDFLPLEPPAWSESYAASLPTGRQDRMAWRFADGNWLPLADWADQTGEELEIAIPRHLLPADAAAWPELWERMTTAAPRLRFLHQLTGDDLTKSLLSDGFTPDFLTAVLLRAAEACTTAPFDRTALVALGSELRFRCGISAPAAHPLALQLVSHLRPRLSDHFFEIHQPWRDTFLPLVLLAPSGQKTVLLPGGRLPGLTDDRTEALRQEELRTAGFRIRALNAGAVWEDYEAVVGELCAGT